MGEAVGIIAAQSIGEPGTQLTMRTFLNYFFSHKCKNIKCLNAGGTIPPEQAKIIKKPEFLQLFECKIISTLCQCAAHF